MATATALVGIGCDVAQDLPAEVLAFSIRENATAPVEIIKLHTLEAWSGVGGDLRERQRTPFSFQRFLLAKALLESGHDTAIYMDSDMLVLRPIQQLIDTFSGLAANIATSEPRPEWRRRRQSSVLAINREGAKALWAAYQGYLSGALSYDELIYLRTAGPVGTLPAQWNSLEHLDEATALLHYTDMDAQPWLRDGNPNAGIWYAYLWRFTRSDEGAAKAAGEIELGHVRPALRQVMAEGPSLSAFSTGARLADLWFVPPHRFAWLKSPFPRRALAPLLRIAMAAHFLAKNGQPNIR